MEADSGTVRKGRHERNEPDLSPIAITLRYYICFYKT